MPRLVLVVCLLMGALGFGGRVLQLGSPPHLSFDEHHFVNNARRYQQGERDLNDHPPMTKLLLLPALRLFGDQPFSWRIMNAALGCLLVFLIGLVAQRLFDDARVGLLAASFAALDGMLIAYARNALPDTPLWTFVFAMLALLLGAKSWRPVVLASLCLGLALSVKWTAAPFALAVPLLLWKRRLPLWWVVPFGALSFLTYLAVWSWGLWLTHLPVTVEGVITTHRELLSHHAGFTVWDNPGNSRWFTWPFMTHPLITSLDAEPDGWVRCTTMLGNPLTWYATTAAVLTSWWWLRARATRGPVAWALFLMLLSVAPFVFSNRQSYFFHAMGADAFGLGLLAFVLVQLGARWPRVLTGFVVAAALVGLFYFPVWTNRPEPRWLWEVQLPVRAWR